MVLDSIKLPRKERMVTIGDCDCVEDEFHRIVSMDNDAG